jgi:hypothetical protein
MVFLSTSTLALSLAMVASSNFADSALGRERQRDIDLLLLQCLVGQATVFLGSEFALGSPGDGCYNALAEKLGP